MNSKISKTNLVEKYRVGMVAKLAGVNMETLRVWQRRYGIFNPERTSGRHKLFTYADIERLKRIKILVDQGHAISIIASLPIEVLEKMTKHFNESLNHLQMIKLLVGNGISMDEVTRLSTETLDMIVKKFKQH